MFTTLWCAFRIFAQPSWSRRPPTRSEVEGREVPLWIVALFLCLVYDGALVANLVLIPKYVDAIASALGGAR